MKKLKLIISAKYISSEMQTFFGKIPPTLLPYKNKPVISHIVENTTEDYDVRVIVSEGAQNIINHLNENKLNCEVTHINTIGTLADSILAYDFSSYSEVLIILGDTLIEDMEFSNYKGDTILYSHVSNPYDYTAFTVNEKGQITLLENYINNPKVFCGIYSIANPNQFYMLLNNSFDFYTALIEYSKMTKFNFIEEKNWIDLGHYQKLQETEMKEVEARYFNEIIIDRDFGILTKKSQEKEKFINEINWYLKLPKQLEYIAPRIFEYSTNYNDPYIKMEYYGYLTLHHMYLHGNFPLKKWDEVFNVLLRTSSKMNEFKANISQEQINASLKKLYFNKTVDRLSEVAENSDFNYYFQDNVIINGNKYLGITKIVEMLESEITRRLLNIDHLSIIHGDYFFANILYDSKSNFVRLVDPRGDFGGHGIYGDTRYDIAKLAHSIDGKYDYIVADKFTVSNKGDNFSFEIQVNNDSDDICQLFLNKISKYYNIDEIMLIESLLFLSMVPLHKDYPTRQHVMIMTGITQFNRAINK